MPHILVHHPKDLTRCPHGIHAVECMSEIGRFCLFLRKVLCFFQGHLRVFPTKISGT